MRSAQSAQLSRKATHFLSQCFLHHVGDGNAAMSPHAHTQTPLALLHDSLKLKRPSFGLSPFSPPFLHFLCICLFFLNSFLIFIKRVLVFKCPVSHPFPFSLHVGHRSLQISPLCYFPLFFCLPLLSAVWLKGHVCVVCHLNKRRAASWRSLMRYAAFLLSEDHTHTHTHLHPCPTHKQ